LTSELSDNVSAWALTIGTNVMPTSIIAASSAAISNFLFAIILLPNFVTPEAGLSKP